MAVARQTEATRQRDLQYCLCKFTRMTSRTAGSEPSDCHCQPLDLARCNHPNRLDTLTDCRHRTNGIARVTSQTQQISLAENAKFHGRNTTFEK